MQKADDLLSSRQRSVARQNGAPTGCQRVAFSPKCARPSFRRCIETPNSRPHPLLISGFARETLIGDAFSATSPDTLWWKNTAVYLEAGFTLHVTQPQMLDRRVRIDDALNIKMPVHGVRQPDPQAPCSLPRPTAHTSQGHL